MLISKLDKAEYFLFQALELLSEEPRSHSVLCGDPAFNSVTRGEILAASWSDVDVTMPKCEHVGEEHIREDREVKIGCLGEQECNEDVQVRHDDDDNDDVKSQGDAVPTHY